MAPKLGDHPAFGSSPTPGDRHESTIWLMEDMGSIDSEAA